jgi:hypothetical protein
VEFWQSCKCEFGSLNSLRYKKEKYQYHKIVLWERATNIIDSASMGKIAGYNSGQKLSV